MAKKDLSDYIEVKDRIQIFYGMYPMGSIQTEIIDSEKTGDEKKPGYNFILIKAYAYRWPEDPCPAVGHAHEWRDDPNSFVNKTSMVENGETSAVGRALANLGIGVKKAVASKEEVQRAQQRDEYLKNAGKTAVQVVEAELNDAETKKRVAVFNRIGKAHDALNAKDTDNKLALLKESGIGKNFSDIQDDLEKLTAYAEYLEAILDKIGPEATGGE